MIAIKIEAQLRLCLMKKDSVLILVVLIQNMQVHSGFFKDIFFFFFFFLESRLKYFLVFVPLLCISFSGTSTISMLDLLFLAAIFITFHEFFLVLHFSLI